MDQDRYRKQQKEANYRLLEMFALIGCIFLGWKAAHDRDYNPWLMLGGLALTFVSCYYAYFVRHVREMELSYRQRLSTAIGIALGMGWSFGMFFGIFR